MKDRIIFPRPDYEDRVMSWMGRPVIKVLSGIRRSGKSSILLRCKERLIEQGVPESIILHINMELLANERFQDIKLLNDEVHKAFKKNGRKVYLFLDEVQEIPNWEKYKRVFAFGCSFTHYSYPTWANLIAYQNTDAEFYNFGKAGMGN